MTSELPRFLLKALSVASTGECRFLHGAVVVKHGRTLALAANRNRNTPGSVPVSETSYHAEVAAIRQVSPESVRGAILYVARYSRKDGLGTISRPCDGCWDVISKSGIKRVVYTTGDGRYAEERP